jgi:N utilization substance protein A
LFDDKQGRRAVVTVAADQLSLAIGRGGQNVRLAAKLTGWKIDIKEAGSVKAVEPAEDPELEQSEVLS